MAKFVMFLLAEQLKRKITKSTAADFSPPLSLDWLIFFPQSLWPSAKSPLRTYKFKFYNDWLKSYSNIPLRRYL